MIPTKEHAETRRELGIERAGDHADDVDTGWTDRAADEIAAFARAKGQPFVIEEVRPEAETRIGAPPDERAWGAAARKALRAGAIRKVGYAPTNSSNRSPKTLWACA